MGSVSPHGMIRFTCCCLSAVFCLAKMKASCEKKWDELYKLLDERNVLYLWALTISRQANNSGLLQNVGTTDMGFLIDLIRTAEKTNQSLRLMSVFRTGWSTLWSGLRHRIITCVRRSLTSLVGTDLLPLKLKCCQDIQKNSQIS